MWQSLFDAALGRMIRTGALEVTYADGTTRRYGTPGTPAVALHFTDAGVPRRLLMMPELALGEAYMYGHLLTDDLRGLMRTILTNQRAGHMPPVFRIWGKALRPFQRFVAHNRISAARANVRHHYDLSSDLYDLFLDSDRQYSCAYFLERGDGSGLGLDAAQEAKKRHIAAKLCLAPGMRVLDIGCGWGGLALTLARDHGAHVTGVTLSAEQHRMATERAKRAGLAGRIDIRLADYRELDGTFDRVVSVGMLEHVGLPHYARYFRTVRRLLTEDGVALIHTIGVSGPPQATGIWMRRHIFPGGYLPSLSEVVRAVEKADLPITDVEVLRDHYGHTLRHWADRFDAQADRARELYDDRFVRMWRYYLIASECSFLYGRNVNFQVQIARTKGVVPRTRDYLYPGPGRRTAPPPSLRCEILPPEAPAGPVTPEVATENRG